jgi:hypothetical protein
MNFKETCEALLAGETVKSLNGDLYKLEEGELVILMPINREFTPSIISLNLGCELVKRKPKRVANLQEAIEWLVSGGRLKACTTIGLVSKFTSLSTIHMTFVDGCIKVDENGNPVEFEE